MRAPARMILITRFIRWYIKKKKTVIYSREMITNSAVNYLNNVDAKNTTRSAVINPRIGEVFISQAIIVF